MNSIRFKQHANAHVAMNASAAILGVGLFTGSVPGAEPGGPPTRPGDRPELKKDVVVVVCGSSISINQYGCPHTLPAWTGGYDRVPPQIFGQNVFFRVFEMLNDHENMCWRRLTDRDWTREGEWTAFTGFPYGDACYGKRIAWAASQSSAYAELTVPAGYEKMDLIYATAPDGDGIRVTIDGEEPDANALVESNQSKLRDLSSDGAGNTGGLDSHGNPMQNSERGGNISHLYEVRARYALDPSGPHKVRVRRATADAGKVILIWGAVYWRGNCVQVVQRSKGGINCGDLPSASAVQEVLAVEPDYILLETINIRDSIEGVRKSLTAPLAWCAQQAVKGRFKVLVYSTCQASSETFRAWFSDPAHKPPHGAADYQRTCSDKHAAACHQVVVDLCATHGLPLEDVGAAVDVYCRENPSVRFVPHILEDWYHPNYWGAALYGQVIYRGIGRHWPELPVRPVEMPAVPATE